jgi:hypothetical protein
MTKITYGTFTSAKGNTFQTIPLSVACDLLGKALGMPLGGIGTRGDSVLLFPPKAPKSKATIADERASKGAAGPVTSLADLQAQMAALMALVQAGAVPTGPLVTAPAPAAKRAARKAG